MPCCDTPSRITVPARLKLSTPKSQEAGRANERNPPRPPERTPPRAGCLFAASGRRYSCEPITVSTCFLGFGRVGKRIRWRGEDDPRGGPEFRPLRVRCRHEGAPRPGPISPYVPSTIAVRTEMIRILDSKEKRDPNSDQAKRETSRLSLE